MKSKSVEECLSRIKSAYKDGLMEGWDSSKLVSVASRLCNLAKVRPEKSSFYYKKAQYYLEQARESARPDNKGRINWLIAKSLYEDFNDPKEAIKYAKIGLGSGDDKEIYEFLFRACEEIGDYEQAQKYSLKASIPGYAENPITDQEIEKISIDNLMDQLIDPSNIK